MRPNWFHVICGALTIAAAARAETVTTDICIYGGTASGVAAAVQAARMGKSVVIAEFGRHIGGLTSGGLGATDIGNKAAIGGISREFYGRVAKHYAQPEAWLHETREDYFKARGQRTTMQEASGPEGTMWTFEPHVAEKILRDMLGSTPVRLGQRLATVQKQGPRIVQLTMEDGTIYRARMFIDATYEGDLMAKAGVSYTVGREANALYGETLNGIRAETPLHQFEVKVDPYVKAGDPASGLLPFIQSDAPGEPGGGDKSVQAYNFRLCYTHVESNKLPHKAPENYDPATYELLARYIENMVAAGKKLEMPLFWLFTRMPNGKTDINNKGAFSTDFIGANHAYPEATYSERAKIWKAHIDYVRGYIYFLATSPRVPDHIRQEVQSWGPAKDEFADTDHWPHQLYVREARRMVSTYVMTELNCRGHKVAEDVIALAAYMMDSHNCRRIVRNGYVENEGDVEVHGFPPYPISYRAIVPKQSECENLLVPICLSASHIAYGSIRMEPVFMILGQSAATAAAMAIDSGLPVQKNDYAALRARLVQDKQVLEWTAPKRDPARELKGIVVDDAAAERTGHWHASGLLTASRAGSSYVHDNNSNKGLASLKFIPELAAGDYQVVFVFPPNANRATNVPVVLRTIDANGKNIRVTRIVNQRAASSGGLVELGTFKLPAGRHTSVEVSNTGTDGHVVADAVQFIPVQSKP